MMGLFAFNNGHRVNACLERDHEQGLGSGCSTVGFGERVATRCPHPSVCPQEFENKAPVKTRSAVATSFSLQPDAFVDRILNA